MDSEMTQVVTYIKEVNTKTRRFLKICVSMSKQKIQDDLSLF